MHGHARSFNNIDRSGNRWIMYSSIGFCTQCGAQGEIGATCEYCGSMITTPLPYGNHSMIDSWSDYRLDGFSIVSENVIGDTDFPEFQVVKGDRTEKMGLIDRYGAFRIPCIYDHLNVYLDYNLCSVVKDNCNGVYNTDGHVIIPFGKTNPLGIYIISNELIVGYNTVYDLQGNQRVLLPTDDRVVLVSNLYATTLEKRGLYSLETGDKILSDDYKIDELIDTHLIIASKMTDGFTRYGIYDCISKDFALPIEFTSIQSQTCGKYEARAQYTQGERCVKSKTLILTIKEGMLKIEREDIQSFQKDNGPGCLLFLLSPIFLILLYLL